MQRKPKETMHRNKPHKRCKSTASDDGDYVPSRLKQLEKSWLSAQTDSNIKDEVSCFDPTKDLYKYQKMKDFPPNQLSVWNKYNRDHLNDNLRVEAESAYLFEIESMEKALFEVKKRGSLPHWACQSIKAWWEGHCLWADNRNQIFHDIFVPRLEKRFIFPEDVIQAHRECYDQVQAVSRIVSGLKEKDFIDDLLQIWKLYQKKVSLYVNLARNQLNLIYHAFFSPQDVVNLRQLQISKTTSTCIGGFIHFVGVDHFQSRVLPRENYPPISWSLHFKKHYDAFVENMVVHLESLQSGKPMRQSQERSLVEKCRKRGRTREQHEHIDFNPFDPIYQVNEDFPPDKSEEWEEDFDDHINANPRCLRNLAHLTEVAKMKDVLTDIHQRGPLKHWEVSSIQKWVHAHQEWVVRAYEIYNSMTTPWISTRLHCPTVLLEGHKEYIELLKTISELVQSLKPGDSLTVLMMKWIEYDQRIKSFYELYNRMHVPLLNAYFGRKDQADFTKTLLAQDAIPGLGATIYHTGKEKFRKVVMKRERIDDVDWHLRFGWKYVNYCETVVIHIAALKSGVPPTSNVGENLLQLDGLWDDPARISEIFD